MTQDDLNDFVEDALRAGKKRDQIGTVLEKAGWTGAQVQSAIAAYADVDFPVAVPKPAMSSAARELFLYLLLFSALYMTVMGIGTVLYQLINMAFPDPSDSRYGFLIGTVESRLRTGVAILIVFLPAYMFIEHQIATLKRTDPQHIRSDVRRKITYLTLYVAATILLSDIYYLVDSWLSGELFTRVLLKCLVVGGLAGVVLGRYLYELRTDEIHAVDRSGAVRLGTLALLVTAALGAGAVAMINVSSPVTARQKQADSLRETGLQSIDTSIMSYARQHKILPASLDELSRARHVKFPRDPITGKPYGYVRVNNTEYRLCTTFYRAGTAPDSEATAFATPESTFKEHPAGTYCFPLSAKDAATSARSGTQVVSDFDILKARATAARAGADSTGNPDAGGNADASE
jgi:ABC-type Co2+ transport system permease subunit